MRIAVLFGFALALLCSMGGAALASPIYVIRDKRGVVTFTSRRPKEGARYALFKPQRPAYSVVWRGWRGSWRGVPIKSQYDSVIHRNAVDHNLDPALLRAVVHVESAFNPRARSRKGAMGLMQLMPDTAKRFGVANAYHPEQNVSGGSRYLKFLLERYRGNERLAVAAYNAGEGAVDSYGTIPPYEETQTYVTRVLAMRELYGREKGAATSIR